MKILVEIPVKPPVALQVGDLFSPVRANTEAKVYLRVSAREGAAVMGLEENSCSDNFFAVSMETGKCSAFPDVTQGGCYLKAKFSGEGPNGELRVCLLDEVTEIERGI